MDDEYDILEYEDSGVYVSAAAASLPPRLSSLANFSNYTTSLGKSVPP